MKKGKRKLCVNVETEVFNCWVCGFSGRSLGQLMLPDDRTEYARLKDDPAGMLRETVEKPFEGLPPGFTPFGEESSSSSAIYAAYLSLRQIPESSWILWRLGYIDRGALAGRVVIPSFGADGLPNFWAARAVRDGHRPNYILPSSSKDVVSNEHMIDWSEPVYLVEGPFDQIELGPQTICLWGVFLGNRQLETIARRRPPIIHVCLDSDARVAALAIAWKLCSYGIDVTVVRYDGKDPSSVGRSEIERAAASARLLRSSIDMVIERL